MQLLQPESGLIVWTSISFVIVLLMIAGLIHLLLNKRRGGKDALRWMIAIVFIPVFGPLIYFKTSRKEKRL